jgi:hypothetical protein
MYAKPSFMPLDVAVANALCCRITVGEKTVTTPLCRVPFCAIIEPCSVTVGPVTVSG